MAALHQQGARFAYFNGFLAWDLGSPRSPARRALLEQRREVVASAGNLFVDEFAELGPEAGVSWFNDWSHTSAVGQRRIGALMCAKLTRTGDEHAP